VTSNESGKKKKKKKLRQESENQVLSRKNLEKAGGFEKGWGIMPLEGKRFRDGGTGIRSSPSSQSSEGKELVPTIPEGHGRGGEKKGVS